MSTEPLIASAWEGGTMRRETGIAVLLIVLALVAFGGPVAAQEESSITCHRGISPGQVADW